MGSLTNEIRKRDINEKINKPLIKSVNIEKLALRLCQKYEKELKDKKFFSVKNILNLDEWDMKKVFLSKHSRHYDLDLELLH